MTATTADTPTFAALLASETAGDHRGAERSPFLGALMGRTLPLTGYVDLLVQYQHVYRALEDGADALADTTSVAPFLVRDLDRGPALEADLVHLRTRPEVAGRTFSPTAATEAYAARIRTVAASEPARYVSHHYTRYLGDLSGGFPIGRIVAATYGLTEDEGGRFAHFPGIEDPARFKDDYRTSLNETPWSADERAAVLDEVHRAYRYNVEVFASLDHHAD